MPHPLKWEFPGGKLMEGESAAESIVREIREEMNVEVSALRQLEPVVYRYSERAIRLIPLVCALQESPEAISLTEHASWQWVDCKELGEMDWLEADLAVVEQVRKFTCAEL